MIFFMQDLTKPYEDKIYIQQQKLDTAAPILSAEASISANQLDEAMATIEQHLRNNPRDGYAVMTKARILKRQAMQPGESAANRESLLKQAIRSVDESIALLPDKAEPIFNKACYQAQLDPNGLKDDILANLESAFRLNPSLRQVAKTDDDLGELRQDADFINIIGQESPPEA
jgi:tetratricopeptide (TPR) repeat protein